MSFVTCRFQAVRHHRRHISQLLHQTDQYGLPLRPSWSVNQLLSSCPSPEIPPSTLKRLHELSALIPPLGGSLDHARITRDVQEMVRLVEAVKLVDTHNVHVANRMEPEDADRHRTIEPSDSQDGRFLMKHATRTVDEFYAVDMQRKQ